LQPAAHAVGIILRSVERNKAEATLRACVRELESALREQTRYHEVCLQARENRCLNVRNLFLLNEKERAVRKLRAKLHRLYEENLIICTERINELEKKYEAINCHLKKIEANIQDLHGKMNKFVVGSVAVVAGWWFFP